MQEAGLFKTGVDGKDAVKQRQRVLIAALAEEFVSILIDVRHGVAQYLVLFLFDGLIEDFFIFFVDQTNAALAFGQAAEQRRFVLLEGLFRGAKLLLPA